MKYKLSKYDCLIITALIVFFVGYFGAFSILLDYIPKIVFYIILLFLWIILMKNQLIHGIRAFKKEYLNEALSVVVVMLIVSAAIGLIARNQDTTIISSSNEPIALMLFSALIFSPIAEELINRCAIGLVLEKITSSSIALNAVSALFFSFLHIFKMETDVITLIIYACIYFMLGFVCSYYYRKNDNIIVPIIIHFFWNSFVLAGDFIRKIS